MKYLIRDCQPTDVNTVVDLFQKHADYEQATFDPIGKEEGLKNRTRITRIKQICTDLKFSISTTTKII